MNILSYVPKTIKGFSRDYIYDFFEQEVFIRSIGFRYGFTKQNALKTA